MAIATVLEAILQGEAYQTYSSTVETADVVRGMALKISDNGKVAPATAASRVVGVALFDAIIGEEVTYALVDEGAFIARMLLTESQTVEAGDPLEAASITISGVTTDGLLAKQTDASITDLTDTFAALTDTFTDWTLGATPSGSDINTAANALIDELDGVITHLNDKMTALGGLVTHINGMIDEVQGIQTQAKSFVGIALEDKTTTTDEAKVIKVLVKGASL